MKLLKGTIHTLTSIAEEKWHVDSTLFENVDALINNPYHQTLYDLIQNLDSDVRSELIALMLVGRGDIEPSDFNKTVSEISDGYLRDDYMWIVGKPIHQYLQIGIDRVENNTA